VRHSETGQGDSSALAPAGQPRLYSLLYCVCTSCLYICDAATLFLERKLDSDLFTNPCLGCYARLLLCGLFPFFPFFLLSFPAIAIGRCAVSLECLLFRSLQLFPIVGRQSTVWLYLTGVFVFVCPDMCPMGLDLF
jgi:hypothetical protein